MHHKNLARTLRTRTDTDRYQRSLGGNPGGKLGRDGLEDQHFGPRVLECLGIPYTGAGPSALAACYDKGLVRAVAQSLDVPVPLESYVRPGDQGATLPSVFPALLKPNHGDSSQGITKDSVVHNEKGLLDYLGTEGFDAVFGARPLRRVIQNQVEDRLSDALLEGSYEEGDTIRVDYADGEVRFERVIAAVAAEPALTP